MISGEKMCFFLFFGFFGDVGGDNVLEGSVIVRCWIDVSFMILNFDYVVNIKFIFNNNINKIWM